MDEYPNRLMSVIKTYDMTLASLLLSALSTTQAGSLWSLDIWRW